MITFARSGELAPHQTVDRSVWKEAVPRNSLDHPTTVFSQCILINIVDREFLDQVLKGGCHEIERIYFIRLLY